MCWFPPLHNHTISKRNYSLPQSSLYRQQTIITHEYIFPRDCIQVGRFPLHICNCSIFAHTSSTTSYKTTNTIAPPQHIACAYMSTTWLIESITTLIRLHGICLNLTMLKMLIKKQTKTYATIYQERKQLPLRTATLPARHLHNQPNTSSNPMQDATTTLVPGHTAADYTSTPHSHNTHNHECCQAYEYNRIIHCNDAWRMPG